MFRLLSVIFSVLVLTACMQLPAHKMQYDQNSWKTMISDSCQSFFDGCNNCRRSPGAGIAACTRKMCFEYAKPVCKDKTN